MRKKHFSLDVNLSNMKKWYWRESNASGTARDLFGVIPSLSFSLPLQMFVYFHNLYTILLIAYSDNIS